MAYQRVEQQFTAAHVYANAATAKADTYINALATVVGSLQLPSLEMNLEWPTAPTVAAPTAITVTLPSTVFPLDDSGSAPDAPSIDLADITAPVAPVLPTYVYTPLAAPDRPQADLNFDPPQLPAALEAWTPPPPPEFIQLSIEPFGGVNSHDDRLSALSVPDTLSLVEPSAFTYTADDVESTPLLEALTANILGRINGNTALPAAVEAELWNRGRDRESQAAAAAAADVIRTAESRGFSLPTGALHAQLREVQRATHGKLSELSHNISIEQAKLAQENARHALEQGLALEGQLLQAVNNVQQRVFEAARFAAQSGIEIFNAKVAAYRANLEKFATGAAIYRAAIDGEQAKIAQYRAMLDAERTKVDVNQALTAQYRAQVELRSATVAEYRSEIEAAQVLLSANRLELEVFGERVRAYTAEINAESVRAEVFKVQNEGNRVLTDTYRSNIEAYAAQVSAKATYAKAIADTYDAQVRGYTSKVQGYATRVGAASEQSRAATSVAGLQVEVAKAGSDQIIQQGRTQIELYRAMASLFESTKSIALQKAKIAGDNYFTLRSMVADASKVAAQVNSQLAASAYGTLRASAQVSGQDSTSTGFSYSGRTSDTRAAPNYS